MASIFRKGGRKGGGHWVIEFSERRGVPRRRVYTGTDSLDAARALARKYETEALLRRRGVTDTVADRLAAEEAKPLALHLVDFVATLKASGATAKHVARTETHVRRVLDATGAQRLSDLAPSPVQCAVGAMIADAGVSHRTANAHLTSIKHFAAWLWREGRTRTHTLVAVKGFNVEADRRLVRRALADTELVALLHAAYEGGPILDVAGPDRAMLYALAVGSGLRAGELASLAPESFNLAGEPPTVTVEAGYSKRRRRDVQPLPRGLADVLGPWLVGKAAGVPVFGKLARTADMLKADLESAGIEVETPAGVADFHSLRHTYVTRLVASGVNVKLCQELARHSDPKLTLGVYSHVGMADKALALAMVPALEAPRAVPERVAFGAAHECYNLASPGTDRHNGERESGFAESAGDMAGRARIANPSTLDSGGPWRIRTSDRGIMSPLL